ncbi:alpha/beta fold hydrolase [Streptomyces zagrosensis]|uniref:Pimeloyl-ACP methyl ester carboxylesterase n=1 Tax=Streptomyces zagrosensis TaxID=1042984 RepID=A0A7W9Q8I6_9ACTN|nr:alpha/beta hydrolase [Streptomyces zagrosensis]MBB5935560.1 pimeloyl-ACP methyl ester carboxylesterase [Streptomyces zagrosensis]
MLRASAFGEPALAAVRDGRQLHYVTAGHGDPLVVFEAGGNGSRTTWGLIQGEVARTTATLSYDRAGFGRSEPDSAPRTFDRIVDDLEDLISAVSDGPCVLVGHSLGGPICRSFARRHPDRVAGLVLVDQAAEDCGFYYKKSFQRLGAVSNRLFTTPMARIGVLGALIRRRMYADFPAEMLAEIRSEEFSPAALRAHRAKIRQLAPGLAAMRSVRDADSLPDVAVTLISARRGSGGMWSELSASHQRLAQALPRGEHVWAERSGHMVPMEEPSAVVCAVLKLLG